MLSEFTSRRLVNVLGEQAASEICNALSRAGSGPTQGPKPTPERKKTKKSKDSSKE
jgi:hypothetical protein